MSDIMLVLNGIERIPLARVAKRRIQADGKKLVKQAVVR
jgi:hypothetical protein